MQKRRICCFCEKWESGGIESFLFNVLTHMDLHDLEVDIVASCLADSVFARRLKDLGVHFFELSGSQRKARGMDDGKGFGGRARQSGIDFGYCSGL